MVSADAFVLANKGPNEGTALRQSELKTMAVIGAIQGDSELSYVTYASFVPEINDLKITLEIAFKVDQNSQKELNILKDLCKKKLQDYHDVFQYLSLPSYYQIEEPINKDNFNILMFNVPFFENKSTAYLFGDSNLLLVLRSKKVINEMFNENYF